MKKASLNLFILLTVLLGVSVNFFAQTTIPTPKAKPGAVAKPTPKPEATPTSKKFPDLNVAETWAAIDKPDIRTLKLNSKLMGREMPYRVIVPRDYEFMKSSSFPVIYLLHGLTGHYDNWTDKTRVGDYLRGYNVIIVTPEGGDGWYSDSASVPNDKYESYIMQELIPEIEKNFRAKMGRENRAIAGLSMGGYGALKFALKYPDKFIMAGSFSGALGIVSMPTAELKGFPSLLNVFGPDDNPSHKDNDIFKLLKDMPAEKIKDLPYIYVSCGTEDFLLNSNLEFRKLMSDKKVAHEYRELPGGHEWPFWDAQIQEFLRQSDVFIKNK